MPTNPPLRLTSAPPLLPGLIAASVWMKLSTANFSFNTYKKGVLKDAQGQNWTIQEDYLKGPNQERLERLPAHNIFWFAWFNSYQETRLVK